MCEICQRIVCPPGCPNYDQKLYGWCDHCSSPIYVGDPHAVTTAEGLVFCSKWCFEDYYGLADIDWSEEEWKSM